MRLNALLGARRASASASRLLNIGSGMIIGLRICASMLIGTIAVVGRRAAWLLRRRGASPADAKRRPTSSSGSCGRRPGMLVAGGIDGAVPQVARAPRKTFRALRGASVELRRLPDALGRDRRRRCRRVAARRDPEAFIGTPVWQSRARDPALASRSMLVALRVLGETNWGPISTMTNLMQALFGAIAPGNVRANMVVERDHRLGRGRVRGPDAGLQDRRHDRLDAAVPHVHAAARGAGRRARAGVHVPAPARHVRDRRRERASRARSRSAGSASRRSCRRASRRVRTPSALLGGSSHRRALGDRASRCSSRSKAWRHVRAVADGDRHRDARPGERGRRRCSSARSSIGSGASVDPDEQRRTTRSPSRRASSRARRSSR